MQSLKEEIKTADMGEINLAWCVLKRQDKKFGIRKKLEALAYLFCIPLEKLLDEAIKDEGGRVLDKPNREVIHEILINAKNGI